MSAAICLLTAAGVVAATLTAPGFTLSWRHSIEKVEWQEDWRLDDGHLIAVAARIRGSGAGMEPPDGAVLRDGWWHYRPALPPLPELVLARSRFVEDYRICQGGACRPLAELVPLPEQPGVTIVRSCVVENGR